MKADQQTEGVLDAAVTMDPIARLAKDVAAKVRNHSDELRRTRKPVLLVLTPPGPDHGGWDIEIKVRY